MMAADIQDLMVHTDPCDTTRFRSIVGTLAFSRRGEGLFSPLLQALYFAEKYGSVVYPC